PSGPKSLLGRETPPCRDRRTVGCGVEDAERSVQLVVDHDRIIHSQIRGFRLPIVKELRERPSQHLLTVRRVVDQPATVPCGVIPHVLELGLLRVVQDHIPVLGVRLPTHVPVVDHLPKQGEIHQVFKLHPYSSPFSLTTHGCSRTISRRVSKSLARMTSPHLKHPKTLVSSSSTGGKNLSNRLQAVL